MLSVGLKEIPIEFEVVEGMKEKRELLPFDIDLKCSTLLFIAEYFQFIVQCLHLFLGLFSGRKLIYYFRHSLVLFFMTPLHLSNFQLTIQFTDRGGSFPQ